MALWYVLPMKEDVSTRSTGQNIEDVVVRALVDSSHKGCHDHETAGTSGMKVRTVLLLSKEHG